ncbi:MAG: phosphoserine phosphatase SerB [Pseudomonadota bacterium]
MPDSTLILSAPTGTLTAGALKALDLPGEPAQWLSHESAALFQLPDARIKPALALLDNAPVDWLVTPEPPKQKALFLADMDSTMIEIECIDELADYAGVKDQVAAVTEQAMRGELDFREALAARVQLLEGLPVSVLQDCFNERVRISSGAEQAVKTMASNGCHCMLVSGGFTFFTQRIADALGFHGNRANQLEERGGHLTGKVLPPISDASTKLSVLQQEKERLSLDTADIMAVGDGANDIPMIEAAGLGIAYRAKPKTRNAAAAAIDHSDLTALLHFQGIST